MEDKVKNLQDNLKVLRMAAFMSQADLGRELGVTRQMINNLENKRNNMTLMQYHAILHVFQGSDGPPWSVLNSAYQVLTSTFFTDEYKEYVRKGVLMYTPAYFIHYKDGGRLAYINEIADHFEKYLDRFDGKLLCDA